MPRVIAVLVPVVLFACTPPGSSGGGFDGTGDTGVDADEDTAGGADAATEAEGATADGSGGQGSDEGATAGSESTGTGACTVPGCPCADDDACEPGLTCVQQTCQDACGNGTIDGDEACDDGNTIDDDTCTNACQDPRCGDGIVSAGEGCDDGNDIDSDGCTNACALATCGDGRRQAGEECDDGNDVDTDACLSTCVVASCGDGHTWAGREACDDANAIDTDACLSGCVLASCGDGLVWEGEEDCDDANASDTDSCLGDCSAATCGDGLVWEGVEACDDGNAANDDACTNACGLASCGDGIVQAGEDCDDGNAVETDDCLTSCLAPTCGDGVVWAGNEDCDDANDENLDACPNDCLAAVCGDGVREGMEICDGEQLGGSCLSEGYDSGTLSCTAACTHDNSGCGICGNGQVDGAEDCDGGNLGGMSCDALGYAGGQLGCQASCAYALDDCVAGIECGDGLVAASELCFAPPVSISGDTFGVEIVDLNGDGHLDVAVGSASSVVVFVGDGSGALTVATTIDAFTQPWYLASGDIDGDGTVDLAFRAPFSGVRIAFGAGDGTFPTTVDYAAFSSPAGVVLADLDGDTDLDLAVADDNDDNIAVRLNNGSGTFGAQIAYDTPAGVGGLTYLESEDIDEDGDIDLYASQEFESDIVVLPGLGNGLFDEAALSTVSLPGRVRQAAFVDLTGDGELDVASPLYIPDTVAVRFGQGGGVFEAMTFEYPTAGDNPIAMAVEDFDSDGWPDLAVLNSAGFDFIDNIAVLANDGTGLFFDAVVVSDTPVWEHVALGAGDLNEDGVPDLVSTCFRWGPGACEMQIVLSDP